MKVNRVRPDNRRKAFEVRLANRTLWIPYAKLEVRPSAGDPVTHAFVDPEIAREGFTYVLASGREGTVHAEQVLDYNRDPGYLRDLLVYKLTVEAAARVTASPLAKREIVRRLDTSAAQLYRLLDPTNDRKSIDQLLRLLHVLDCDVDLVVRRQSA